MKRLLCAADDCQTPFDPYSIDQVYCSPQCAVRMRVRRYRERKRCGGGDDGGGKRQRMLFPKTLPKAKPPKTAPVAEPTLFGADMLASIADSVTYREGEDSPRPISNISGILLTRRKPSASEPSLPGAKHAA